MSKLLELIVQHLWQAAIKPLLDRLDRWDLWFVTALIAIGYVQWAVFWENQYSLFSYPKGTFNVKERWCWGMLLMVATAVWFAGRRVINAVQRRHEARVTVSTVLLALLCVVTPLAWWYFADQVVYRIVPFAENDVGIYIARLRGDRADQQRDRILAALDEARKRHLFEIEELSFMDLPKWIMDHDGARRIGDENKAKIVLWGSVSSEGVTQPVSIDLKLTPVNIPMPAGPAAAIVRTDNRHHLLFGEVSEDFARALLLFLTGYEKLISQQPDYIRAIDFLQGAEELLPYDPKVGLTSEQALRASVLFYLANALLGCASSGGEIESCGFTSGMDVRLKAKELYREAAQILAVSGDLAYSYYVEALNNLAFLDIAERQPAKAKAILNRANTVCEDKSRPYDPNPWACLHVAYNLGTALQELRDYAAALPYLEKAISRFEDIKKDRVLPTEVLDYWILTQAYQAVAFGHAKRAEMERNPAQRLAYFDEAEKSMEKAVTIMKRHGFDEPSRFGILRARIHIGRGRWVDARTALGRAEPWASKNKYADFYLLSAIAEECLGNRAEADGNLGTFLELNSKDLAAASAGTDYYKAVTRGCKRNSADPR